MTEWLLLKVCIDLFGLRLLVINPKRKCSSKYLRLFFENFLVVFVATREMRKRYLQSSGKNCSIVLPLHSPFGAFSTDIIFTELKYQVCFGPCQISIMERFCENKYQPTNCLSVFDHFVGLFIIYQKYFFW